MRALLAHCKEYGIVIGRLSTRPKGIVPEPVREKSQLVEDCLVALVTVEEGDSIDKVSSGIAKEIIKMAEQTYCKDVVILPFAHLSNKIAHYAKATECLKLIEDKAKSSLNVKRAHFGSHKELLLHLYGHPGNIRYREF